MSLPRITISALLILFSSCHSGPASDQEQKAAPPKANIQKVSIDQIEQGIKTYIQEKTKTGGGFFHVKDKEKELRMKLVRVHTEYLSNLGPKRNFACVDLADVSG
ncbi:MAG TPA: transglutaminase domain-containing protein, partial [Chryseosolibacter sp.]